MSRAPRLLECLPACFMLAVALLATTFQLGSVAVLGQEPVLFVDPGFDPYTECPVEVWGLQVLPDGLLYSPYLAGPKESRTGIQFFYDQDSGWLWDAAVGGQLGILRYGTEDTTMPVGIQFDVEGSAQFRSTGEKLLDILSTDIRIGFPVSIGWGRQETKLAFYLLRTQPNHDFFSGRPQLPDQLFERRAFVLGHSVHPVEQVRIYGEVGYAFGSSLNGDWEFQFGAELAPKRPTKFWGAPFAAANMYLLETTALEGTLTAQAGWAWRGKDYRLLRIGLFYQNGLSNSYALTGRREQQVGFGIWHDF